METNFNFKSQPATSRKQSERLLALGLKKETRDAILKKYIHNDKYCYKPVFDDIDDRLIDCNDLYPAWSLGRLIELMPRTIVTYFPVTSGTRIERFIYAQGILTSDDSIAEAVSIIEWLIKGGYFNKEYLV